MTAIYEPIYRAGQTLTEPSFQPLRIETNDRAEWREFYILVEMYRRGLHRQHLFTGLMSPKFGRKTKITGAQFLDFVRANANSDVCFINPFPHLAYISFNGWMQGEIVHPGLMVQAQRLLDASGVALKLADAPRQGPDVLCFCNYWVGTEKFWDQYVGGLLLPIAEFLEKNPTHPVTSSVFTPTLHTDPAPFLPFIIERLFSTYLCSGIHAVKASGYPLNPTETCKNEFERQIVVHRKQAIDAADRSGIIPNLLKNEMALFCRLSRAYDRAHDTRHPHSHVGDTGPQEITSLASDVA